MQSVLQEVTPNRSKGYYKVNNKGGKTNISGNALPDEMRKMWLSLLQILLFWIYL